jgi:hypothetical protein
MKNKPDINRKLPSLNLAPEVAYTLSNWLFGLAHDFDMRYRDEIRSHMLWLDKLRNGPEDNSLDDDDINF